ncbi:MAG: Swarming motility protein SwrC [Deltaproteobacteria bacterium ADurb.Bin058]|nr:MAG: Swarming motility protein SwrC [Deltaproteobacteria bacterium ADurb.Bin058]
MNLAAFSLRNKPLLWLVVITVIAWGVYNYNTISRREDPEVKISVALVITIWPGKGAEDVERLVTHKLEEHIEKMASLRKMKSTTRENLSLIFVDVDFDADTDLEWQKLRSRLEEARQELPDGAIGPIVMDDFGDVTAMIYSLRSKDATPAELKYWANRLKSELKSLETVGKINLLGEQEEVIYIEGPMDSFSMYGFSPLTASKILDAINVNIPAGYMRTDDRNFRLDTSGSFSLLDEIANAILDVSTESGAPLKVRDVFSVRKGFKEPPNSYMMTNGEISVGLDLRMQRGYNVVAMGKEVKAAVEKFMGQLPPNITLELIHDQPREVDEFIGTFMNNLFEGLIIVIVVMFLLMGLRPTLVVAVSLPLSIIATIALMPSFNLVLEQVSIAAFIIALGMLVDNAIIVVDNVSVHLDRGKTPVEAACKGTQELVFPILTGTLATVLAFLPLRLLKDEIGSYVTSLPMVISISMLVSFVLAVTVTPVLAASFLRKPKVKKSEGPGLFARAYAAAMRAGLKMRYLVVALSLVALAGAVALVPMIGLSFFPEMDRDQFTIDIWLPEGVSINRTREVVDEVEAILKEQPEIKDYAAYVGEGGPRFHITVMPQFNMLNYARFMVGTHDKNKTRLLAARLNEIFKQRIAGARIQAKSILLGIPLVAPIAIEIRGPDLEVMQRISREMQEILRSIPGTTMVRDDTGQEVQSLRVEIDNDAALMAGITNTEVALALLTANEGLPVTDFREGEDRISVVMRAIDADRKSMASLDNLYVPSLATGAKVPLRAIAKIEPTWAPGVIYHVDGQRTVTVLSDVDGRLASDIMREAWPRINSIEMPPGYSLSSEGEEKERESAFGQLNIVFALIIAGLLFMLTIQFKSIRQAATILFSVPLAIIGAILGLFFSGNSFSFMAFLGVTSLAGIVIKNAVVWAEFVERALEEGLEFQQAIIQAGIMRLRPILLTAMTTMGGLLPLGLFGGVLWEGMAWAMIAGLALATVLTLYVIPIVYYLFFKRQYERPKVEEAVPCD